MSGRVVVMATDGGPHAPDKWAVVTAEHIVDIDPMLQQRDSGRYMAARRLQIAVAGALVPHHAKVQRHEQDHLKRSAERFSAELDASEHLDDAIAAIQAAARGTLWEAHFQDPAVVDAMCFELHRHFATSMDIERQWHARRNKDLPEGQKYLAAVHPVGEG